jgi:hypothetical protein
MTKNKLNCKSRSLEAAMMGASTLMETERVLDTKSAEYVQGFVDGFGSCLELSERFESIICKKT